MAMLRLQNLLPLGHRRRNVFTTDHLMGDLKTRSARGGAVTMATQGAKLVLQMGSTAVLARLLTPADFGLIAMVMVFTGFVAMFQDLGLSMATIQRKEINHGQVSTLFWVNVGLSGVLAIAGALLAPAVAWFYGEPELLKITIVISATLVFGGLGAQHVALLRRQMRYTALAVIEVVAMSTAVGTAFAMAGLGAGYWALVALPGVRALVLAILAFAINGWIPGLPRRGSGVMPMLKYGGNLTATNFLSYFNRQFDNLLIGSVWGASSLGLYSKAYGLLLLPLKQIDAPISSVAMSSLSRLQDDPDRYRSYFRKGIQTLMFGGMGIVGACFVAADAVIAVMLGPQWDEAVPIFKMLAPAALVGTTYAATTWAYLSLGQTGRQLRWRLVDSAVTLTALAVGVQYGAIGVAAAFSIAVVLLRPLEILYCYSKTPLEVSDFLRAAAAPATATVTVTAAMITLWDGEAWVSHPAARLLAEFTIFGMLYIGIVAAMPSGRQVFRNFKALRRPVG